MSLELSPATVPVVVTSITFTTIALTLVAARIYTRTIMLKIAGMDDWLILAAVFTSIAFCATVFYQVRYGLGEPFRMIPMSKQGKFFQYLWASIPLYNLSLALSKVSIVLQYRRIFETLRQLCNIMIAVFIVYGCWAVLGSMFLCIPVASQWDRTVKGHCMNRSAFFFSNAALNIVTDIMVFASPIPSLVRLRLPKKQKIGLIFVFGCGAFVSVTSIIRLKGLYDISVSNDASLQGVGIAIWSGIEINVAIACASLPTLKPLISKIRLRHLFICSSRERSDAGGTSVRQMGSQKLNALCTKFFKATPLDDETQVESYGGASEMQSYGGREADAADLVNNEKN